MNTTPNSPNGHQDSTMTKFEPKEVSPPEVDVEIEERIPTDAEVVKAMQELGFSRITEQHLKMPAKLGAKMHKNGVIRTQRGGAFMTQHRLSDTLELLHLRLIEVSNTKPNAKKENNKTEQMCKLAHEIGFTAGKLTESQELVISTERGRSHEVLMPDNNTPPQNMPFPVGATVPKEVHYHVHAEKPVVKNG